MVETKSEATKSGGGVLWEKHSGVQISEIIPHGRKRTRDIAYFLLCIDVLSRYVRVYDQTFTGEIVTVTERQRKESI